MDTQVETNNTQPAPVDPKRLRKRIRDRERRFKQATPAGKRVMIAKDVINSLGSLFKAGSGNWLKATDERFFERRNGQDLRKVLLEENPDCTACALGALFACAVMRDNKVRIHADESGFYLGGAQLGVVLDKLEGYFDDIQLRQIEVAFERGVGWYQTASALIDRNDTDAEASLTRLNSARAFGERHFSHEKRMVAIMKNIIKHKGEFRPDQP